MAELTFEQRSRAIRERMYAEGPVDFRAFWSPATVAKVEACLSAARHLVADALATRDGGVRDGLSIQWASIDKTRDAFNALDKIYEGGVK